MPRHRVSSRLAAVAVLASTVAACTTPVHSDPANAPNALVSSLDRIRDGQARLGGSAACLDDAYCAAGLTRVYGIQLGSGAIAFTTPAAAVSALAAGAIDIAALPGSAIEASDPRVTVLRDDRGMQPADNVVPVVSSHAASPTLARAVDGISATLDDAGLAGIDQQLAGGSAPELAASDWLSHHPALVTVAPPAGTAAIIVGSRPDPESAALAHIYAGALSRMGWSASVAPVADRMAELQALGDGRLALVPDRTADLLEVLSAYTGASSANQHRNLVLLRAALSDLGLVAYEPAPAAAGDVFVVSSGVGSSLGVATLSDLARVSGAHAAPPAPVAPLTKAELATDTESPPRAVPSTVGVGSSGAEVEALQARLDVLGYAATVTGTFDEATRRAVQAFQGDAGLVTSGALDPATARVLNGTRAPRASGRPAPLPGDVNSVRAAPAATGGPKVVYLLLAGSPSGETAAILDELAAYGAKATFFASESAVGAAPETLRSVRAAGDGVGVTEWPHNGASPIAVDVLARTASSTQVAVSSVDGVTPTCFLPPYGASDPPARARAAALGLQVVLWDVDPQDWRAPGADVIANDVIDAVRPGSFVLLHDDGSTRGQTVAALGQVLRTLSGLGYTFAAVPGC
ncbi:MAG TPA: glycine betaine ABC transporter substrate-binding protein [Acidimicrobiales bacterium]|nr:glycine betaine ABC transporter substrate-binding protein [Acidimicrobiales bacterium]